MYQQKADWEAERDWPTVGLSDACVCVVRERWLVLSGAKLKWASWHLRSQAGPFLRQVLAKTLTKFYRNLGMCMCKPTSH